MCCIARVSLEPGGEMSHVEAVSTLCVVVLSCAGASQAKKKPKTSSRLSDPPSND